jgi:hypothetical protein
MGDVGNRSFRVLGLVLTSMMLLAFLGAAFLSSTHRGEAASWALLSVGILLFFPGLLLLLLWGS